MADRPVPRQRLHAADPLWKRAPSRLPDGEPVGDFMMLIPGLGSAGPARQQDCLSRVQRALLSCGDDVVFADFNARINVLWISHRCRRGITLEILEQLQAEVPEARLIANQVEVAQAGLVRDWGRRWSRWLRNHLPETRRRKLLR